MALRLVLAPAARRQLDAACLHIAAQGATGPAHRLAERMSDAMLAACDFPRMGRKVSTDVYELTTVWPYIIRYQVTARTLRVIRIRHGAMRPD